MNSQILNEKFSALIKFLRHFKFIKQPGVLPRVFWGYFRTNILRQNTLRSIELAVTYNCQASCHKCYAMNLHEKGKKFLSVQQIRDIMTQARKLGAIHVNITGGEPTLRNDIVQVIRACHPKKMVVSLVTNALALTRERIFEFKNVGLNTIQISLDSAIPEVHDKFRGVRGCFDKVMKAAHWAREANLNLCFSTVLSTESESNSDSISQMLSLAESEDAFLLLCDSASIGGWEGKSDKMFSLEGRNRALAELLKHPRTRHHNLYNFSLKVGCPAAFEKIYITAYGGVTPCDLIHDIAGDLLKEPLRNIWERMISYPVYAMRVSDCIRYHKEFLDRRPF